MLGWEQIKDYFPQELAKLNPKGILVEYLQYEILDSIFKQAGSEKLSFIGGTAIRIINNSQRFSEDLDFDNFGLSAKGFHLLLEKACAEMKLKGFELEREFVSQAPHYHCYIKFPALLNQLKISGHKDEKILVSIDAETKKKIFKPEIKALNKFGVFRNLPVNPATVLLAQKLLAILYRKREKGRDFYDASFLWGLAEPDYIYLKKLTDLEPAGFKQKLLSRCQKLNYKALANDVAPFLFSREQTERVLSFKSFIEEKIKD
ncbi:hypothetical protein A2291_08570 [candidate division WOR-1 bacterium RIFOXYB2_FULL_42_35]|uniref:Nucleotidyltransferase n=1 Tax=candidate division WOR-1 bacterium RIFOXYC2_FULL_41_25 TaxID=1802586 RepID=A0A1F4TNL3_UNCSA|nr:MAG: hypothetical protein A2291_08570 [candidate division WOR-1 bacterium RIFOXYB2_FULL_42_35]OGC23061.1 MAG: hypothetical protein A2247_08470 [candidate division WOR-1 bacterium RIFOXYA2_FULL_41_14]OGC33633.1 MAG: hypothetical protein A2462_02160 [candidate division WOR-1 bacterium RIFOXYC2_FULL_41_25]OGC43597.1 MAG: hypothetical protein A2548_02250 [candidate division WOR-1 bacterium RIFOXYD2_FULL_41_8]